MLVLRQLQHDRLQANTVCSTWRTAANAATTSVQLVSPSRPRVQQLRGWLQAHGQRVRVIELLRLRWQDKHVIATLPCSNLVELAVAGGTMQLPLLPASVSSTLTKLASNEGPANAEVKLYTAGDRPFLQELCGLTSLQHLCLHVSGKQLRGADLWHALLPLRAVTHLELSLKYDEIWRGVAQHISVFTRLQDLCIHDYNRDFPCVGEFTRPDPLHRHSAPTTPHRLALRGCICRVLRDDRSSLRQLTNLRTLDLYRCWVEASALSDHTGLESLTVSFVKYVDTQALYAWLPRLHSLTFLQINGPMGSSPPTVAAHSGFTASSSLRHLALFGCDIMQPGWHQMFPPGKQLLQLTRLEPALKIYQQAGGSACVLLEAADIEALARCCPALKVR